MWVIYILKYNTMCFVFLLFSLIWIVSFLLVCHLVSCLQIHKTSLISTSKLYGNPQWWQIKLIIVTIFILNASNISPLSMRLVWGWTHDISCKGTVYNALDVSISCYYFRSFQPRASIEFTFSTSVEKITCYFFEAEKFLNNSRIPRISSTW